MQRRARQTALVGDEDDNDKAATATVAVPQAPNSALPLNANYESVDHPADTGVVAWGNSLADAIAAAGLGMYNVMTDTAAVEPKMFRELEVKSDEPCEAVAGEAESDSIDRVVYKALDELLGLYGCEYFVCSHLRVKNLLPDKLLIQCWGEPFHREKHSCGTEVKAITMHGLRVNWEEAGGTKMVKLNVLFDI